MSFSCLLVGAPGAGKTTAASTAPTPILFLDVDNKLHKMVNLKEKLANGAIIQVPIDEPLQDIKLSTLSLMNLKPGTKINMKRPKGYQQLADAIDKIVADKGHWNGIKLGTVVLDSYTTTDEHIRRLLMSVNGSATMTLPLYGTLLTNFETLNNTLLRLPCNVIMICHQKPEKDELTGIVSYTPLINGQMSTKIAKDFEEVYFMEKKVSGGKATYEMLTIGSSMKPCRTSRLLEAKVEPNFQVIYGDTNG